MTIPALLLVRHHKNLRRILAGTEPKVAKRGSRRDDDHDHKAKPSGRIQPILLIGLTVAAAVLLCGGLQVIRNVNAPIEIVAAPWALRETHRELTGQQRSTRVVFTDHGRQLAVMCPRYNKVLVYRRHACRPISTPRRKWRSMAGRWRSRWPAIGWWYSAPLR